MRDVTPVPSVSDALLLAMVRDYVGPLLPSSMLDALRPYLDRADLVLEGAKGHNTLANWRDKVHAVLPTQALIPPVIDADVYRLICDALLQETQLEIVYDSMSGKKGQTMPVHPYAMIHREQMTYLVGTCHKYTDMRRFALHRIRSAKNTYTPMVRQADFDLNAYLKTGHGDFGDGQIRQLDILISAELAKYLNECKLSVDQQITAAIEPQGWYRLQAEMPDTPQLKWWLLSQGDEVFLK